MKMYQERQKAYKPRSYSKKRQAKKRSTSKYTTARTSARSGALVLYRPSAPSLSESNRSNYRSARTSMRDID